MRVMLEVGGFSFEELATVGVADELAVADLNFAADGDVFGAAFDG